MLWPRALAVPVAVSGVFHDKLHTMRRVFVFVISFCMRVYIELVRGLRRIARDIPNGRVVTGICGAMCVRFP